MKMRKTRVCDRFFQQNDLNYGGLSQLFQKLFDVSRKVLQNDNEFMGTSEEELDLNMVEISNFVMYNLY